MKFSGIILHFKLSALSSLKKNTLKKKIEALKAYKSQEKRYYATENFIRSLAITRGVQIGADFAEAFEVIRWVI